MRITVGLLTLALLAGTLGGAGMASASAVRPQAWPQFMYGPGHRSFNSADTALSAANVSNLRLRFRTRLGTTTNKFNLGGSVAAARGVLYTSAGDGSLYAVNATTGKHLWSTYVGCCFPSGPAVSHGTVYVQGDQGQLFAVSAATGAVRWADTVSIVWGAYVGQPTVVGSTVYVLTDEGNLDAIRTSDGSLIWSRTFSAGSFFSSPAVAGGVVYAGIGKSLVALDAATGQTLWTRPLDSAANSSPSVDHGRVFVLSYSGTLYAIDQATGAVSWHVATGGTINASSPAVAYGRVYAANLNGDVAAYNETTGALDWHANLGAAIVGSPALAGGLVFVCSEGTNLTALSASTGKVLIRRPGGSSDSSPAVVGGAVFVASAGTYLSRYSR